MALLGTGRLFPGAVLAAAIASGGTAGAQSPPTAEPDIKAAFLFNFARFVEWPPAASAGAFQICSVAAPGFDAVLARTLVGESTDGRPIVRATPEGPELARACHILFIARQESQRADRWVAAVRGYPVLVVGESRAAEDAGAHITFVVEDNRVKFDVNEDAAAHAGLKISSKLLRVARHVTSKGAQ